jgi:hypothetical protein
MQGGKYFEGVIGVTDEIPIVGAADKIIGKRISLFRIFLFKWQNVLRLHWQELGPYCGCLATVCCRLHTHTWSRSLFLSLAPTGCPCYSTFRVTLAWQ